MVLLTDAVEFDTEVIQGLFVHIRPCARHRDDNPSRDRGQSA
jgi:hypothetical protein